MNQDNSSIVSWEQSLGFTSLRATNEGVLDNQDVDAVQFNDDRVVKDVYFESVLSADAKLKVGDSLYQYDFNNSILSITNLVNQQINIVNLSSPSQASGLCETMHKTKVQKIYSTNNGDVMLVNEKWVQNWWLYNSIGTDNKVYKKKKRFGISKWRKHEISKVSIYLDQWSFTKAGGFYCELLETKTNIISEEFNSNGFGLTYHWGTLVPIKAVGYGRLHCWIFNNYNDDVHNEEW